jgi:hypothetical protein
MRRLLIASFVALAACSPQIDKGTYYCGPERLCPPDLSCDDPTFTCDAPSLAERFSCPVDSEGFEPDDSPGDAQDAGKTSCGQPLLSEQLGCIDDAADLDHVSFEYDAECVGDDPHLEVVLRFPVAFVPLTLELLDDSGSVIETGVLCTPSGDHSGSDYLCLEARPPAGHYVLRVQAADGPDCDGDCHYNQYYLQVSSQLS